LGENRETETRTVSHEYSLGCLQRTAIISIRTETTESEKTKRTETFMFNVYRNNLKFIARIQLIYSP